MIKSKKFGTFSGVFTPSILTILGVIMYMRLGWVVGQAGLWATLAIIIIAHIISITTGLSISSIATDKKIKAGGIYYILSRSLGLPMGGAIGIALTIGTALSISMYIVGFAENFLSIPQISNFLNLVPSVQSYRIVGTVILVILVILALISTSLAIKTQYLILGAIVLSLVSIFIGFGMHPEFHPSGIIKTMANNGVSIEKVFAIFFPAVTGFTAGVAMSGDLKNPKKNIPIGTLLAIFVGFVIYIALAIGFAYFVNRQSLLTDNSIAVHIAWIPSLVIAGIWGATLSSALGGILGGPRILQALSKDKILPLFFAKGHGQNNEPRNALLLIAIIAESGILIGDLNIIAGVVTMFYLTSYGFINLAYVLENWASTDFRPSFKVNNTFAIIGFLFAFAIMFKLDMISMLISFLIIGLIYFVLQRKQLKLDYGDVWQSVWISIIRKGLSVLEHKTFEDRNWQPNIILFSGGSQKRPYLLEFGKSLVGKYGLLTNFDLIEEPQADVLFPKHKQSFINKKETYAGIFYRRQSCKEIYTGIDMIVRTYGFSGIEPNTVIMGWAKNSKNPEKFVKLLETINSLDYNLILIDFDERYKFGQYKQIDIWWRGAGNNGNFALTLSKFLKASNQWENATIRLMIVNDQVSKSHYLFSRAKEIISSMRIEVEIKIVNNELEKRAFYDIIRQESNTADLVFIGIPAIKKGEEKIFITKTNSLLYEIGTVVLIKASSLFKDLNLGVNLYQKSILSSDNNILKTQIVEEKLFQGKQTDLYQKIQNKLQKILNIYDKTIQNFIYHEVDDFSEFLIFFSKTFDKSFANINKNISKLSEANKIKRLLRNQNYLIKNLNSKIEYFEKKNFSKLSELLENAFAEYIRLQKKFFDASKNNISLTFPKNALKVKKQDSAKLKLLKNKLILSSKNKENIQIIISHKEIVDNLENKFLEILFLDIEQIRIETLRFIYNFEMFFLKLLLKIDNLKEIKQQSDFERNIEELYNLYTNQKKYLKNINLQIPERLNKNRQTRIINTLNDFQKKAENIDKVLQMKITSGKKKKNIKNIILKIQNEVHIFFDTFEKYLSLLGAKNMITTFKFNAKDYLIIFLYKIEKQINKQDDNNLNKIFDELKNNLNKIIAMSPSNMTIIDENSLNESLYKDFVGVKTYNLNIKQILSEYNEKIIISPLQKILDTTKNIDNHTFDIISVETNKIISKIKKLDLYNYKSDL